MRTRQNQAPEGSCFAFGIFNFDLAFPGPVCYDKRADGPYRDGLGDCIALGVLVALRGTYGRIGVGSTGAVFYFGELPNAWEFTG